MAGPHQIWQMPLDGAGDRPLCRQRPRGHRRRAASARAAVSAGLLLVRPAQRTDLRRQVALRGRQRGQLDPRRALRPRKGTVRTVVGTSHLPTAPAVHLRRRRRAAGPRRAAAASAGRRLLRRPALRGRHLQQQDQGDRSGDGRGQDACRHRQARAAATIRPSFDEPAGISAAAGKLYVADTNNHLIRVIDLRSREQGVDADDRGLEAAGGG